jgi:hypothetical protein
MELIHAAEIGDLDWFQTQLLNHTLEPRFSNAEVTEAVLQQLVSHGYVEILRQLEQMLSLQLKLDRNQQFFLILAIKKQQLQMVQYLFEESRSHFDIMLNEAQALNVATENGQLEIIRYFFEKFGPVFRSSPNLDQAVRYALIYGHLDVVEYYLFETIQPIDTSEFSQLLNLTSLEYSDLYAQAEKLSCAFKMIDQLGLKLFQFLGFEVCQEILEHSNSQISIPKGRV